jgi:CRISPR system Cascade subunit CasB
MRDRAAFAELRRCADLFDIVFVPAFGRLRRRMAVAADDEKGLRKVADIAALLAHVKEDDERRLARALGTAPGQSADLDSTTMSPARFRRLLQADEPADRLRRLIRAVKILKGRANVADLADAVWFWGDWMKQDWAFRYLGETPPTEDKDQVPTIVNEGSKP